MALQSNTIKKLFREIFKEDNPMRAVESEREGLDQKIRKLLEGMSNVKVDAHGRTRDRELLVSRFSINEPGDRHRWSSSNHFRIVIDEMGRLAIKEWSASALISDFEELLEFVAVCRERIERRQVLKTKRRKIREFKTQAIIAQVKKLAKDEKFDFYTETDTVKLKLYVRLSDKECIQLFVPFNRFQEVLPNLRTAIVSLRELIDMGIKFKVKSSFGWHSGGWIEHESL